MPFFLAKLKDNVRDLSDFCGAAPCCAGTDGSGRGRASVLGERAPRGNSPLNVSAVFPLATLYVSLSASLKETTELVERREGVLGDEGLTGDEGLRADGSEGPWETGISRLGGLGDADVRNMIEEKFERGPDPDERGSDPDEPIPEVARRA